MQARCCCDSQNALVQGRCAILRAMQARCCHDPQNALVEEGVLPLRCHASCCCDPQNALVEEGVLLRCHASSLLL
jgi:hypothetical protein